MPTELPTEGDCPQCGHEFNPHAVIATTADPMTGGIILCPVPGCRCYSTWATPGTAREDVIVPSAAEIARVRMILQGRLDDDLNG